jgi:hypothetical protein
VSKLNVVTEFAGRVLRRTTKKLKSSQCFGKYSNRLHFEYKSLISSVCQINFILCHSVLLQCQLKMFLSELFYIIENIYFVIYLFITCTFKCACGYLFFSFILSNTLLIYLYLSSNYVLLFIYFCPFNFVLLRMYSFKYACFHLFIFISSFNHVLLFIYLFIYLFCFFLQLYVFKYLFILFL